MSNWMGELFQTFASDGHFYFDGRLVCCYFFNRAFHFSPDLYSSSWQKRIMKEAYKTRKKSLWINMDWKKDRIVVFLEHLATTFCIKIPDSSELYHPF